MSNDRSDSTRKSNHLHENVQVASFPGQLIMPATEDAKRDYHAGRLNQLTRLTVGDGVVCGIDPELATEPADDDESTDQLKVTLKPGVALDGAGNHIVVESETTKLLSMPEGDDLDDLYLYLRYDECAKKPKSVGRDENACKTECRPSRILETFEVFYEKNKPDHTVQSIPQIKFPTVAEKPETGDFKDDADALFEMAESYFKARQKTCETVENPVVFVGHFTKNGPDGKWVQQQDDRIPYVFTNEMLHAITARHATDFTNPHDATLTVRNREDDQGTVLPGALVEVADDANNDPVTFRSSDDSILISANDDPKEVDLTADVSDPTTEVFDRYLRARSLWCGCAFRRVSARLGLKERGIDTAEDIYETLTEKTSGGDVPEPKEYVNVFRADGDGLVEKEKTLADDLEDLMEQVEITGLDRYWDAFNELDDLVKALPDAPPGPDENYQPDTIRDIAMAHERLCTMLSCLSVETTQPVTPGCSCFNFTNEGFEPLSVDTITEEQPFDFDYIGTDTETGFEVPLTFEWMEKGGDEKANWFFEEENEIYHLFIPQEDRIKIREFSTSYVDLTVRPDSGQIEAAAYNGKDVRVAHDWTPAEPDHEAYKLTLNSQCDLIEHVELTGGNGESHLVEICLEQKIEEYDPT